MTSILLNEDAGRIVCRPVPADGAGRPHGGAAGLPPAWIPPQPAPFVGGDISAGMAALLYGESPEFPFLLADMGTNGEFVLALDKERSFIASVPLGPSLEGIGLRYGGWRIRVASLGIPARSVRPVSRGHRQHGTETDLRHGLFVAAGCAVADRFPRRHGSPCVGFCFTFGRPPRALQDRERGAAGWKPAVARRHGLAGADVEEILKVKAAFSLALKACWRRPGWRAGRSRGFASAVRSGTHAGNRTGAAGLSAAGPAGAHCGGGQHLPARGGASADAPGTAGEAGPLEFRVYACGSGGPSRFYGPVHAAYGFRISAVRLQEAAFCGIASVFDTL